MAVEKVLTIDFAEEEACTKILPRSPLNSSYNAKWDGIRLDYHQQPAHETPEHSPKQHVISICLAQYPVYTERVLDGQIQREYMSYGDIVVVPANIHHKLRWDKEAEFIVLSLEEELFACIDHDSIYLQHSEILPHFASRDPLIQHIGLALKSELESDGWGSRVYVQSLATTLCVHLLKHYSASRVKIPTSSEGLSQVKLRQVIKYINDNLEKDLTLAEIAAAVGMSMYHFSRLFKQSTGLPPHQYITNYRIERAKKLLARTEETINQICQEVGFQNQSHFTNVFRKLMGITPKVYREKVKI